MLSSTRLAAPAVSLSARTTARRGLGDSQRRRGNQEAHHKAIRNSCRQIYGCDIALFPAHLATLNLAARQIHDEENYPLIRRGNFFEVIEQPDGSARFRYSRLGKAGSD